MNFVCVPALPVYSIRACTGFDGGFEVVEAIRSLPNCVITGNSKYKR